MDIEAAGSGGERCGGSVHEVVGIYRQGDGQSKEVLEE